MAGPDEALKEKMKDTVRLVAGLASWCETYTSLSNSDHFDSSSTAFLDSLQEFPRDIGEDIALNFGPAGSKKDQDLYAEFVSRIVLFQNW